MAKIFSFDIGKEEACRMFLSPAYLKATANKEDGPLNLIIAWFKSEEGHLNFKIKDGRVNRMRLGGERDDFAIMYYYNSKRCKILKTGEVFVSSADPEDMCERQTTELQALVDSILNDEVRKALGRAVAATGGKITAMKVLDKREGERGNVIVGVEKRDGDDASAQ